MIMIISMMVIMMDDNDDNNDNDNDGWFSDLKRTREVTTTVLFQSKIFSKMIARSPTIITTIIDSPKTSQSPLDHQNNNQILIT